MIKMIIQESDLNDCFILKNEYIWINSLKEMKRFLKKLKELEEFKLSDQDQKIIENLEALNKDSPLYSLLEKVKKLKKIELSAEHLQNIEKLEELNTDAELYKFLKNLCQEETAVRVLGIELKYPKIFTHLRGHDLELLLKRNEMFTETISCVNIIDKFQQTGMGIFIPDEIINIYRTVCHNIIHLSDEKFDILVKKKYKNMNWFILMVHIYDNTNDCEEFKR